MVHAVAPGRRHRRGPGQTDVAEQHRRTRSRPPWPRCGSACPWGASSRSAPPARPGGALRHPRRGRPPARGAAGRRRPPRDGGRRLRRHRRGRRAVPSPRPDRSAFTPVKEVNLPASDPLVLAAGGTTLTASHTTGAYISETAWGLPFGSRGSQLPGLRRRLQPPVLPARLPRWRARHRRHPGRARRGRRRLRPHRHGAGHQRQAAARLHPRERRHQRQPPRCGPG